MQEKASGEITKNLKVSKTHINQGLNERLIHAAIGVLDAFFKKNLGYEIHDIKTATEDYNRLIRFAEKNGLLQNGGIDNVEYLTLFALKLALQPELYVESGVFQGSSLHAFTSETDLCRTFTAIGFDPNLEPLRIKPRNTQLIDSHDFSEHEFDSIPQRHLIYFDDHIDSAERIIQAHDKGFKYILFDDSNGLTGISQRLYPAFPTVFIINNIHLFEPGDTFTYPWEKTHYRKVISSYYQEEKKSRVREFRFDKKLIQNCSDAKARIKNHWNLPILYDYLPQITPEAMLTKDKILLELH
jgi:hypothetical protein